MISVSEIHTKDIKPFMKFEDKFDFQYDQVEYI